jgi:putative Mg2+ transporter-C (MgtC) family protein
MLFGIGELDERTFALRIGAALFVGAILGINRDLHHKAAGLRTHAVVSVGAAIAVMVPCLVTPLNGDAMSRVVQGLLTGIGFVGAGVIVHHDVDQRVQGLTTAASVWTAAVLGIVCGVGRFGLAGIGLLAVLLVLSWGGRIEAAVEKRFGSAFPGAPPRPPDVRSDQQVPPPVQR